MRSLRTQPRGQEKGSEFKHIHDPRGYSSIACGQKLLPTSLLHPSSGSLAGRLVGRAQGLESVKQSAPGKPWAGLTPQCSLPQSGCQTATSDAQETSGAWWMLSECHFPHTSFFISNFSSHFALISVLPTLANHVVPDRDVIQVFLLMRGVAGWIV